MLNKALKAVLFVIVFILMWNILDYLFDSFITRSGYRFSVMDSIIKPASAGTVLCIVSGLIGAFRKKDK